MKHLKKAIKSELNVEEKDLYCDAEELIKTKSKAITTVVYNQMLLELGGMKPGRKRRVFDAEYRRRLCLLPSDDLLCIVEAHDMNLVKRQIDTLDAIRQELTERGLLKD